MVPKKSRGRRKKIVTGDVVNRAGGRRATLRAVVRKLERRNAARTTGIDTKGARGRGTFTRDVEP